jgi:hypothetical protein
VAIFSDCYWLMNPDGGGVKVQQRNRLAAAGSAPGDGGAPLRTSTVLLTYMPDQIRCYSARRAVITVGRGMEVCAVRKMYR